MQGNTEINGDIYGIGVVKGGTVNQNLILPKHKVPTQLTSKLGKDTIIGREKELEDIDKRLNNSNFLLLINGIGGIGKSTIASYYLHSQKEKLDYYGFFEGVDSFLIELRSRLDIKAEKEEEAFMEALTKLSALEGNKLLVIDDVKNIEENQETIERILELKNSGYKILLTSREEIEDIEQYYLDVLSIEDAKNLFNSIYEVEDEVLLEEILNYLDCHAFFVEMTAKTLKSKKTLTPEIIKDKFENGEFSTIKRKRKESFNDYLNELFSFDELDDEEILMLKQLSALPSIEISFEDLGYILDKVENIEFEELLNYLFEKGWLGKNKGYKLHQIIKEYLLLNYLPTFEEIETVVINLNRVISEISLDIQMVVDTQDQISFFESLAFILKKLEIKNESIGDFFNNFGRIYYYLGSYKKSEFFYLKALEIRIEILGENNLNTVVSYSDLAVLYISMEMYQKAKKISMKSLQIREKLLGTEHDDTATSYSILAEVYKVMGDYVEAERLYIKAIKIYEKVLGKEHLATAKSYNSLAVLYLSIGTYEKAEVLFYKSLHIYESRLVEKHLLTTNVYHNLGVLYKSLENYEKSEVLLNKSLKIYKHKLGKEHSHTLRSYNHLIELYSLIGEFKKGI